jgi:hypothetical protein
MRPRKELERQVDELRTEIRVWVHTWRSGCTADKTTPRNNSRVAGYSAGPNLNGLWVYHPGASYVVAGY